MSDTSSTKHPVYKWSEPIDLSNLSLHRLIGKGYDAFWHWKGRYLVCKGSRASKKSYTTAYRLLFGMIRHPDANVLVARKVDGTNKDSTYALLCKVIYRLGLAKYFKMGLSPLEITYTPTGQKILFRGLDDPMKLSSVQVTHGVLCWAWVEEAYQIDSEKDFDLIDQCIRGEMPEGLYPQVILTFNPWHKGHWLKSRFFDNPDSETLAITTTYECNEWLSEYDRKFYALMRERSPRMYQTAGLGEWGISEGVIFDDWEEAMFDYMEISKRKGVDAIFGLDFGYTNDPTALVCALVSEGTRELWIFDELYEKAMDNEDIAKRIIDMGYGKERIIYDCSEPKSGYEIKKYGLTRVYPAIKGADSIENGIQRIRHYHIYIHPKCVNTITEFQNYAYDTDRMGHLTNKPIDDFNHSCFIGDTSVLTDKGEIPIKDIHIGDRVMTRKGYRKVIDCGITGYNEKVYRLILKDGRTLIGTPDHPIFTENRIKAIKDIIPTKDRVFIPAENVWASVESKEEHGIAETVYNITVEGEHEYIANGILVRNCDALRYALIDYMYRHGSQGGIFKPSDRNTYIEDSTPPTQRKDWKGNADYIPQRVF